MKYGAKGSFWSKRITFVISKKGKIEKIYKAINVNTHAEKILDDILEKN